MESTLAVYQLIILYMLHRVGGEIAMPHISNFLIENGYVNFETLVSAYEEAENNGFVTSRVQGEKTFLKITEEGMQTLKFFQSQLSDAIKKQADDYLRSIGRELVNDQSIIGEYYKASYGGFQVHMAVKEDKAVLFEMNLNVPTEENARQVLKKWKEKSSEVYQKVVQELS